MVFESVWVARIKKATVDIRKGRGFMPLSGFARILSRLWHSDVCSSSLSRLICFLWGEPLLVCCACQGKAFGQARVLFWWGEAVGRGWATYCRVLFWWGEVRPKAEPSRTKIKPCNKWRSHGRRPSRTKIKPWPGQMPCLGKHNLGYYQYFCIQETPNSLLNQKEKYRDAFLTTIKAFFAKSSWFIHTVSKCLQTN